MQHRASFQIRQAVLEHYGTVREWCDAIDLNYQRTAGVLRGSFVMRLEDLACAERTLSITLF